jgi:hypothetical protein
MATAVVAGGIAFGNTATCNNSAATLTGSAFEVDPTPPPATNTGANQVRNITGCVDWLTASNPIIKQDTTSGASDEAFGNGSKEDTAVPSIVTGGIPPNKSDLKAFGVFTEQGEVTQGNPTGKYLALLWTRVQDPSGTTNMDFELNQSSTASANGVTPVRTSGDKLITYDLSNGGTVATISIRTWNGSAWGPATILTQQNPVTALGTVNTSPITAGNSLGSLGALDPRTFGEASISFGALFGGQNGQCGKFGSAYLKSRSSDSFTAALKDFVPPTPVNISNCPATLTTDATDSVTVGNPISDTATLDVPANTNGSITFRLYGPFATAGEITASSCTAGKLISGATSTKQVTNFNPANPTYTSDNFTPTVPGFYNWTAQFTSTTAGVNSTGEIGCGDAAEKSQVNKAGPAIVTEAQTPVTVGATINDTATLSGGVNPTGTITFKLYASQADCQNDATALFEDTVDVDNGNADYTSGNYTTTTVGNFFWKASYSGDNNNSAISGVCGEDGETSVVGKSPSTLNTEQSFYPNDTATVTATDGGPPSGDVTFSLFNNSDCTGTPLYGPVSDDLDANGEASTNNTSFAVSSSGTLYWKVEYEGDNSHNPVSSCSENTDLAINNGGPTTSQ